MIDLVATLADTDRDQAECARCRPDGHGRRAGGPRSGGAARVPSGPRARQAGSSEPAADAPLRRGGVMTLRETIPREGFLDVTAELPSEYASVGARPHPA